VLLALAVGLSPGTQAFPLSRFTERVSGPGINELGADDHLAERIAVNRPGFFGAAETSGTGAALPGHGGPFAESILDVGADQGGVVSAAVTYYFGVAGPALPEGIASVPLLIDAALLVEAEATGVITTGLAQVGVFAPGIIDELESLNACVAGVCMDRTRDLVFDLGFPLSAEGTITLRTSLFARGAGEGVRVRAVADPFIRVDPAFAFADRYEILVSAGVTNTPPTPSSVPEGSTWGLASIALLALAFGRRRRNRR
jgi:MYXO-CTERM domain-containing protein